LFAGVDRERKVPVISELETIGLEPVESLTITTLVDNVTDILLLDEGPAIRAPIDSRAPRVPSPLIEGGQTLDALRAGGSPSSRRPDRCDESRLAYQSVFVLARCFNGLMQACLAEAFKQGIGPVGEELHVHATRVVIAVNRLKRSNALVCQPDHLASHTFPGSFLSGRY
jgi:hypothetical protein